MQHFSVQTVKTTGRKKSTFINYSFIHHFDLANAHLIQRIYSLIQLPL